MKELIVICTLVFAVGCTATSQTVQQNSTAAPTPPERSEKAQTSVAHGSENRPAPVPNAPAGSATSSWSQGGTAIDTTKFDNAIAAAEKKLKANPTDDLAQKALAQAYYQRGVALTDARQYASALGDYRRALKYNPDHTDARNWIDQIIMIYGSLKKQYPKEGEEPPPLPFKS